MLRKAPFRRVFCHFMAARTRRMPSEHKAGSITTGFHRKPESSTVGFVVWRGGIELHSRLRFFIFNKQEAAGRTQGMAELQSLEMAHDLIYNDDGWDMKETEK